MAQQYYIVDLTTGVFPFISKDRLRTTMVNTAGYLSSSTTKPDILYAHNVMPNEYGMESVGYKSRVAAALTDTSSTYFISVRELFDEEAVKKYIGFDNSGYIYILNPTDATPSWSAIGVSLDTTSFDIDNVTIGTVKGVSYLCYAYTAVYTLSTSNTLTSITLASLDMSTVVGVIGSSGYLLAYTNLALAWSSTIDPTDFDPSDVTGAGGGNVADIRGDILFATENSYGILLYTEGNVITGTYTGNSSYPFKLTPLQNSSGGISLSLTTFKSNYANQFSYTKAGLQSITYSSADTVLPNATDFLSGELLEDYDDDTNEFNYSVVSSINKKINLVASRYLIASYGDPSINYYTHAIVYDISLNKLGKLKYAHVDVIEYLGDQSEVSKESIGLVGLDGSIYTVGFSNNDYAYGTIVLGKVQYSHSRMTKLLGVDVENIAEDTVTVGCFTSYDGKNNGSYIAGYMSSEYENWVMSYNFMTTGKNHSIVISGRFKLNTALIKYATAGRR